MKKLCKSEQRELDAVCHTLSIMYMPFADLRDGYGCSIDKQIWIFHLWHKGLPKWIPSKTIFIMQVVFMDTTPDMLM